MKKTEILTDIANRLSESITFRKIDYKNIYRIKGHSHLFNDGLFKEVNSIIGQIEEWAHQEYTDQALREVEKLLGLIEGLREHHSVMEINETAKDKTTTDDAYLIELQG